MQNDYITNGRVNRGIIASRVKSGKLNKAQIEKLCSLSEVQKVFIGEICPHKQTDKRCWNEEYLDELQSSFTTCFNRDYLLHMCEVAEYLSEKKNRKRLRKSLIFGIVAGIAVIITIFAVWVGISSQRDNQETLEPNKNPHSETIGGR